MKILLLGATGRTGKHALHESLRKGHEVRCVVRDKSKIEPHSGLTLFEGTPADPEVLTRALEGCDAIISILNISRTSDFPWAGLRTPESFMSDVMKTLIPLATENGIGRIVVCSAWGTAETKVEIPGWFRWFINNSNIGVAYRDHERQELLLENSTLNWTIVRPVGLSNSRKEEEVMESYANQPKPNMLISRMSTANFIVNSIDRADLIHKKVTISRA